MKKYGLVPVSKGPASSNHLGYRIVKKAVLDLLNLGTSGGAMTGPGGPAVSL
jgi:hypothetical protein